MSEASRRITSSWDDHYMAPAFYGCVHWALGNDEVMAAYRLETGDQWTPGTKPIDRMIDRAVGVDFDFMQSFVNWCERTIFGTPADLDKVHDGAPAAAASGALPASAGAPS